MPTEAVRFPGAHGVRLAARIDRPVHGPIRGWALFAHCFTCSKNLKPVVHIARALNQEGIGVLRFDFTGLGESEGDFADTNFSSNVEDLVAAGRFMAERGEAPGLLIGHSLGGAAVIHAAHQLPSVQAVATIGAPSDPSHVLKHLTGSEEEIRARGEATVTLAGRPFQVKSQFLDDLQEARMEEAVKTLGRALLVLHSPVDGTVSVDHAARLFLHARHPRSFVSLDDADHLLLRERDSRYAARVIAGWVSRYMGTDVARAEDQAEAGAGEGPPAPADSPENPVTGERVVVRTTAGGFRTDLWADGHYLVADEPRSLGGSEEGPTPYDYLVAALGACTTMTLQMYAARKGWPLEEARTILRHSKRHARDEAKLAAGRTLADGEQTDEGAEADPRLDTVAREIELLGPLTPEQRTRLMEIADRCPVHRTLDAGVVITTVQAGTVEADSTPPSP
jgi:uncharacterized OsmC-like protein/pimeloyl-ACP methyl ester carboxylesterase